MFYEKQLDKIIEYFDDDNRPEFRALACQAFSYFLSTNKELKQPGAVKIGKIPEDKREILLNLIRPEWWDYNQTRQQKYKAQKNTKNIILINLNRNEEPESKVNHQKSQLSSFSKKHYKEISLYLNFLDTFAKNIGNGYVANASIVKLNPNSDVLEHYDPGCYYMIRDRYHVVLSSEGSRQVFEGNEYFFEEGDIWWFNTKVKHSAYNDSNNPRIHLIFDVLPFKNMKIENSLHERFYNDDPIFIEKGV